MPTSLWKSTLEEFLGELAGTAPAPAGVSVAAATAAFALSLVVKTLEITAQKGPRPGELIGRADELSGQLKALADRDAAAFDEYLRCVRLPKDTEGRAEAIAEALRATIEVPLEAARCASAGLRVCVEGAGSVNKFVAPDLGAAAELMAGAVRAILVSVDSNLKSLRNEDRLLEVSKRERNEIDSSTSTHLDEARKRIASL